MERLQGRKSGDASVEERGEVRRKIEKLSEGRKIEEGGNSIFFLARLRKREEEREKARNWDLGGKR